MAAFARARRRRCCGRFSPPVGEGAADFWAPRLIELVVDASIAAELERQDGEPAADTKSDDEAPRLCLDPTPKAKTNQFRKLDPLFINTS
jgi:hypothetical protein